jgi:Fe-S-cluster containining protein
MPNDKQSLIMTLTPEQKAGEEAFCHQLAATEAEYVNTIFAQCVTPQTLQAVIEHASWFAEETSKAKRDPKTPPVECKEGCYWCCFQAIPLTACEVFRISRFLSSRTDESKKEFIEKLRKLDQKIHGRCLAERAKLNMPCAFLDSGRCSIYSVRPLACAEFTSFDVQDCKQGKRVGFEPLSIIHEKARMLVYYAVEEGLVMGLREALQEADHSPLELTVAVLCALESPNAEDLWLAGGKVFAHAHLPLHAK